MSNILPSGTRLQQGKYIIEKSLGQGSFGVTYKAVTQMKMSGELGSLSAKVNVAVKEFFMSEMNNRGASGAVVEGSDISMVQNYRRKFRKEAENLSHLDHPNIVKVLSIFDENNTTYYVMEYLDGESLDGRISRLGKINENDALSMIRQVGAALQYMHEHQMLHLDMKPSNVMCTNDGRVVLIDFGLSKQYDADGEPESSTTLGLGTKGYAPIEQADYRQDGTFPATLDIYALGATLFKMLTGLRPLAASELMNEEGFIKGNLEKAGVGPTTLAAVCKAMSFRRKDRYQSVRDFLAALPKVAATAYDDEDTEIKRTHAASPQSKPKPEKKQETKQKAKSQPDNGGNVTILTKGVDRKRLTIIAGILAAAVVVVIVLLSVDHEKDDDAGKVTLVTPDGKKEIMVVKDMPYGSTGIWSGAINSDSIPDGRGVLRYNSNDMQERVEYNGEMKNGLRNGKGRLSYKYGKNFEGTFENDHFSSGKFTGNDGYYFNGTFVNDAPYNGAWYEVKTEKKYCDVVNGNRK